MRGLWKGLKGPDADGVWTVVIEVPGRGYGEEQVDGKCRWEVNGLFQPGFTVRDLLTGDVLELSGRPATGIKVWRPKPARAARAAAPARPSAGKAAPSGPPVPSPRPFRPNLPDRGA